jgi:hypothetical protein
MLTDPTLCTLACFSNRSRKVRRLYAVGAWLAAHVG